MPGTVLGVRALAVDRRHGSCPMECTVEKEDRYEKHNHIYEECYKKEKHKIS